MDVHAATQSAWTIDADAVAVGLFVQDTGALDNMEPPTLRWLLDQGEARTDFRHLAIAHTSEGRLVIIVGLGDWDAFDGERARIAAALVRTRAADMGAKHLCWELPDGCGQSAAAGLVGGTVLGAYRFDRYRPPPPTPSLPQRLTISASDDLTDTVTRAAVLAHAQNRARDLGNRAPNDLTPAALAQYATELARRFDAVTATVLPEDELRALGMGAFTAVAQGSDQDAQLIALEYEGPGTAPDAPRLALIGKAVTFDSGGLSLKPPASQVTMKFDMGGGAAVIETVAALAELRAPVRVLAVVGAAENTINGRAMKPGDVITALDGTTIEINNTDAEGRLVLADCITWARRRGCAAIVDIATLTGGAVAALGHTYAALFSSDERLAELALECGVRTGERLWRLPLDPEYAALVKGRYAQLTNRPEPRVALASTAAELLHHFAGDLPWAHLDIAGVADDLKAPYFDKGGTGWGVRLLTELACRLPSSRSPEAPVSVA